jgi:large subunit ribosomal protein L18e
MTSARLLEVPKLTVVALRFTETARKRILAAGGNVLTFDQFAQKNPTGNDIPLNQLGTGALLLRARRDREELKHFGRAPGLPGYAFQQ